jgi:hypothetical protein
MSQDADTGSTDVMTDTSGGVPDGDTSDTNADDSTSDTSTDGTNADDSTSDTSTDGTNADDSTSDTSTDGTNTDDSTSDTNTDGTNADDSNTSDISDTTDTSDTSNTGDNSTDDSSTSDAGTTATVDYKQMVAIPSGINVGVSAGSQATMMSALGNPGTPLDSCGTPSAGLQRLMKTASVGPFRVTGLAPAVDALTRVFAAVKSAKPDLYALLGTAGMLCVRHVRGSTTNFSNHSWGTAIDMTIGGQLTPRGSTTVQQGLVDLAPFMQAEQFFWGAAFPTPDGMHFEASNELIAEWKSNHTIP